jgi:hypothetical protein
MNAMKIMQCSACVVMLCGVARAAPTHWRENVVYRTTAGKAEPAVMLPGVTSVMPAAPAVVAQTHVALPEPATQVAIPPTTISALNKGTVSALQSARDATATPRVTSTAPTPTPATRTATAPVVTAAPRSLSTGNKATGAARSTRGALRRPPGSVDLFVDRNNDGYDDRTSALDL